MNLDKQIEKAQDELAKLIGKIKAVEEKIRKLFEKRFK